MGTEQSSALSAKMGSSKRVAISKSGIKNWVSGDAKCLIRPIAKKFSFLGKPATQWIEKQLFRLEKRFNHWFSKHHARSQANPQKGQSDLSTYPTSITQQMNHSYVRR